VRRAVALLVLLAGCASPGSGDQPVGDDAPPGSIPGDVAVLAVVDQDPSIPAITVVEAIGRAAGDIVSVSGALFVDPDGSVHLCDAIAESYPPQCGGSRLEVRGLDLATLPLEEANGVRWAEAVTLTGSVE
jgi:hypothetical protein